MNRLTHNTLSFRITGAMGSQWAASDASQQTGPLKALPTTSSCWMGCRIAPSNPSELIDGWFKHGEFSHRSNQPICSMGAVLKPMQNHEDQLVAG